MSEINIEKFYNIIKNGDLIGFHYKKWYYVIGKIINFFSYKINPKHEKLIQIEHIGMIFDVNRDGKVLTFSFGESLGSENGKKISDFSIIKTSKGFLIDSKFKAKSIDFYIIPVKDNLVEEENIYARKFWSKKGEYSIVNAMISVNWFQKLIKRFIKKKRLDNLDNFCSGEVNRFFFDIGRCDDCDLLPSPAEIINQSYVDKTNIFKI